MLVTPSTRAPGPDGVALAAPDGLALLEARAHPLLRVVGERVLGHDELTLLVSLVFGTIDL